MSERTVTIPTEDHGPVTISEPPWCLGYVHDRSPGFRQDISHRGETTAVKVWTPDGPRDLVALALSQAPFHSNPDHRAAAVEVHLLDDDKLMGAAGLVRFAASVERAGRSLRGEVHRLQAAGGIGPSMFPPLLLPSAGTGFLAAIRDHLTVELYPEGDDAARQEWRDTLEGRVADVLAQLEELLAVPLDGLADRAEALRTWRREDGGR